MKKATALIVTLLAFCLTANSQTTAEKALQDSRLEKYSYVVVLGDKQPFELSDSAFYRISRKVIFPVNKHVIPKNSAFRKEIERELLPYMNDSYHVLDRLIIRGAASPEGPYKWNKALSERRAQALFDIVKEHSIFPLNEHSTRIEIAEDYIYLLMLMKERGDKDYDAVAHIVEQYIDNDQARLKEELKKYDRGRLWWRLLRDYFPELRAARVVMVFKKFHDFSTAVPIEPDHTALTVQQDSLLPPPALRMPTADMDFMELPRRELLSVKTNLLLDLAYMPGYNRFCPIPNVAIEYYPFRGHFTLGASFDCPWWQNYAAHKYFQVRNYQIETRYYFKSGDVDRVGYGNGPAFRGWYLQAYGHMGLYNICFDADRGWEGEGWGAGLGTGYVMPISKSGRWRLEFGLQVGYFQTRYDPYQWLCPVDGPAGGDKYYYKWTGAPEDFKTRQHRFTWIGPTRVGITLSYDLLYRKNGRHGVSFRRNK